MNYLLALAFLFFAYKRLLTYLHIYQQDEYQPVRFLKWLWETKSVDRRLSVVALIVGLLQILIRLAFAWGAAALAVAAVVIGFLEEDPRKASKKRLALTARAQRILWTAWGCVAILGLICALREVHLSVWVFVVQAIPLSLPLANLLLTPFEKRIQRTYWKQAHSKLRTLQPTVIGITGSYGKTSTKHLLGHILEVQAPTLITPGSVNTPMGIARIVREQLGAHHRFFVCEMGAYGPGSIARLCRLAPPDVGVITAIGKAHYERFRSLDTVASAKLELAQAVQKSGGTTVLYQQVLDFQAARDFAGLPGSQVCVVGDGPSAAARILRSHQSASGLEADVEWHGEIFTLRAPIFGDHHIANMAVAFAAACTLGVRPADAVLALASVAQISHRLEVKEGFAHSRLIDDAYNSNPVGFASALKMLDILRTDSGKRILVTPGMVEMGEAHDEEHRAIGRLAASHVDVLLPVVPERIPTLTAAYREANAEGLVVPCPDFSSAQSWLEAHVRADDVVLLENDLPDLYERKLRL